MTIPRLVFGTCAVGGFLVALLLHLQPVEPIPAVAVKPPGSAIPAKGATEAAEKHRRELEMAIAAERERTQTLEQEAARLAATPALFQGAPMASVRRKLTRFAEKNQIPQNLLDRFSILVARNLPGSEMGSGVPQAMTVADQPGATQEALDAFAKAAIDLIGEPAFEAYKRSLPTLSAEEAIRLSFQPALGEDALTPDQTEALAEALVAQAPAPDFKFVASGTVAKDESAGDMYTLSTRSNGIAVVPFYPGMLNRLSAGALEKASSALSPAQLAHFKQLIELNRIAVQIAESGQ